MMGTILSLRPSVTREEAERLLGTSSLSGVLRRLAKGRLRAIAPVYLPFRVHKVTIVNHGRSQTRFFAMDAVNGALDLYGFDRAPAADEVISIATRNRVAPALDESRSRNIVTDKIRRLLFRSGFFRLKEVNISVASTETEIHIPYWLGFYGSDGHMDVVVIDAVRRRIEGAKVSKLLRRWLTAQD